ncbi:preprotein translocase subunit SecA [Novipirellula artificiosorum]|uniref:Protein translocase subunit SecA n=1 Tax=Novipirellula artificiosorum TaxID=2528016 RepID=A0A5C6DWM3_9BACT|nr:preprotein translocase subunit SecA [Novipirellula artificiosorum]TWU41038.1 preprotein translocase subunit SecA [Novipirellula artificiosorum]
MSFFERLFDILGVIFGGFFGAVERGITSIFGSANARQVSKLQQRAEKIGELEPKYEAMTDEQLREQTEIFRQRLRDGETLDNILDEAFAVCREGGKRYLGMRHYDVQFVGGMVLHSGGIAEMVTGEGKTLVATLPAYLNALEGKGVHVVTVNDYLARRDMEWMAPLYMNLGLTVNAIQSGMSTGEKQAAYACDITYGTNNEFGFDYLRDNMRPAAKGDNRYPSEAQQCQGPLNFAIIDEVDNILIDEARTPLIISGPADLDLGRYAEADRVARQLRKEEHFKVDEKQHNVTLSDEGVREAEKLAGVESFYTAGNMEWPHLIDNALKAHFLYKLDVNYVIKDRQIIIVDEFTGRLMEGRQWSDGLHQAVEAKEGVPIKQETQTFATASLQNIFKMYKKLAGMTGTAMTESTEFMKIYGLDVVAIPTNREMKRIEHPDLIYLTEKDKYKALADEVERTNKWDVLTLKDGSEIWGKIQSEDETEVSILQKGEKHAEKVPTSKITKVEHAGRPVLIGTVSIEKSERLSALLERRGIKHDVLNAKNHGREADIVSQAGRVNAVTIATNMAGRGTDIVLGGNPETMAWAQLQHKYPTRLEVPDDEWNALVKEIDEQEKMSAEGDVVRDLAGLYVIGTERHESRRIDLQLRGRCGRQGDPGSSRFFLSLEDDLMRIFAGDFVKSMMERLGMQEGEAIESSLVTRRIAAAQKKVEERNYEIRKSLLDYDEVMDEQRKRVYRYRQNLLDGHSSRNMILDLIRAQIDKYVETFMEPNYGVDSFAAFAGGQLDCQLEARDFLNMDFDMAKSYSIDQAERAAEVTVEEIVEENLPAGMEEEWNWKAMTNWSNTRLATNYQEHQLKSMNRDELVEELIKKSHEKINKVDLSDGEPLLDTDYGLRTLCAWMRHKFGIETTPDEFRDVDDYRVVADALMQRAEQAYTRKEAEYPVLTGISRFTEKQGAQVSLDREGLVDWVNHRFGAELNPDDVRLNRDDLKAQLVEFSRKTGDAAEQKYSVAETKVDELFGKADPETTAILASGKNGSLDALIEWLQAELSHRADKSDLSRMNRSELKLAVDGAVDDRFYPEMRRMERQILLSIVDEAWKNHLLTMDHLRSSVGLKGYAQLDPKVEYKREGMRLFDSMWESIGERVTDLIFRMESFNDAFIRSTWVDAATRHDDPHASGAATANESNTPAQQAAQQSNRGEDAKPDPIRHDAPRIGRNDPCPCGSGKKYKSCCMRKRGRVV